MSQKKEKFEDLGSAHELVEFLKKKGANHTGGYFHYTNIPALKGMLRNHKLHLSSGSEMNDLLEPRKGGLEEWKRLYVVSFSAGYDENMAMWGIYGEPLADALRIKFRCKSLRESIKKLNGPPENGNGLYEVIDSNEGFAYEPLDAEFTVELIDVVYLSHSDRHATLSWNGESLRGSQQDYVNRLYRNSSFAGCLKNVAWKYERETRIVVKLQRALPDVKKVAMDISDALDDIEILCGPCLKKEHLKTQIQRPDEDGIKASQSLGQIHFRSKCNECDSKYRCPRTQFAL